MSTREYFLPSYLRYHFLSIISIDKRGLVTNFLPKGLSVLIFLTPLAETLNDVFVGREGRPFTATNGDEGLRLNEDITVADAIFFLSDDHTCLINYLDLHLIKKRMYVFYL